MNNVLNTLAINNTKAAYDAMTLAGSHVQAAENAIATLQKLVKETKSYLRKLKKQQAQGYGSDAWSVSEVIKASEKLGQLETAVEAQSAVLAELNQANEAAIRRYFRANRIARWSPESTMSIEVVESESSNKPTKTETKVNNTEHENAAAARCAQITKQLSEVEEAAAGIRAEIRSTERALLSCKTLDALDVVQTRLEILSLAKVVHENLIEGLEQARFEAWTL